MADYISMAPDRAVNIAADISPIEQAFFLSLCAVEAGGCGGVEIPSGGEIITWPIDHMAMLAIECDGHDYHERTEALGHLLALETSKAL